MNITGNWLYNEDFEFGKSIGKAKLQHVEDRVSGILTFTEEVENEYKIEVIEKVQGTIANDKVLLESVEVKAIQNNKEIHYLPNCFDVFLVSENKLVGSTYDSENVCGVFVMERLG
jgi:hypothetical protein